MIFLVFYLFDVVYWVFGFVEVIMVVGVFDEFLWISFLCKGLVCLWMIDELVGVFGIMMIVEWLGDVEEGILRFEVLW